MPMFPNTDSHVIPAANLRWTQPQEQFMTLKDCEKEINPCIMTCKSIADKNNITISIQVILERKKDNPLFLKTEGLEFLQVLLTSFINFQQFSFTVFTQSQY